MAGASDRSFAQELNTWAQTIGIVIAAAWAAYTFVYKEYLVPQSAPVNITVNLQLKKIGSSVAPAKDGAGPLVAVEMRVTATNPSSRMVFLFPTAWVAYGVNIEAAAERASFTQEAIDGLNADYFLDRAWNHANATKYTIVAAGRLFPDEYLKPNETAARTLLIFVPRDGYDYLDVTTRITSMSKRGDVDLEWQIDDGGNLVYDLYHVSGDNQRTKISGDSEQATAHEIQTTTSYSVLSLWQ